MKIAIGLAFILLGIAVGIGLQPYIGFAATLMNIALSMIGGAVAMTGFLEWRN